LRQEVLLGIGGVRILRQLGYNDLTRYHMNEGHAALLTLECLAQKHRRRGTTSIRGADIEKVRNKCVVHNTHAGSGRGMTVFPWSSSRGHFPGARTSWT